MNFNPIDQVIKETKEKESFPLNTEKIENKSNRIDSTDGQPKQIIFTEEIQKIVFNEDIKSSSSKVRKKPLENKGNTLELTRAKSRKNNIVYFFLIYFFYIYFFNHLYILSK